MSSRFIHAVPNSRISCYIFNVAKGKLEITDVAHVLDWALNRATLGKEQFFVRQIIFMTLGGQMKGARVRWANSGAGGRRLTWQKEQRSFLRAGIPNIQWHCLQLSDANLLCPSWLSVKFLLRGLSRKAKGKELVPALCGGEVKVQSHRLWSRDGNSSEAASPSQRPQRTIWVSRKAQNPWRHNWTQRSLWTGLWVLPAEQSYKGAQWDGIPWIAEPLVGDTTWFLTLWWKFESIWQSWNNFTNEYSYTYYLDSTITISWYLKKN